LLKHPSRGGSHVLQVIRHITQSVLGNFHFDQRFTSISQYGAAVEGTVADPSGAVVPGARVTATNEATGVSRTTVTGGAGFYRIAG